MPKDVSLYSNYDLLRSRDELHFTGRTWLTLSYAAVAEGLTHPELSARRVDLLFPEGIAEKHSEDLRHTLRSWTFFADSADVKEERKFIWDQLGPKSLSDLQMKIRNIADFVFQKSQQTNAGRLDVINDLTRPIRIAAVKLLLETQNTTDSELQSAFLEADAIFNFITSNSQSAEATSESMSRIKVYLLKSKIFEKTQIDKNKILNQLTLLLVVSIFIEKAIANAMSVLVYNEQGINCLKKDLKLAIREALRLESPTQVTSRIAIRDFNWRGKNIKAGEQVSLVIGSANRDPLVFSNPSKLSMESPHTKPLTFGTGGKHCPGEWMTCVIVEEVFSSLLKFTSKSPRIHEISWLANSESRRPTKLVIDF